MATASEVIRMHNWAHKPVDDQLWVAAQCRIHPQVKVLVDFYLPEHQQPRCSECARALVAAKR